MVQHRFGDNAEFAASVERETELFFQITNTSDLGEARRLAREARELMRARRARWYVVQTPYLADAEDTWLTLEGSGGWRISGSRIRAVVAPSPAATGLLRAPRPLVVTERGIALAFAVDRLGRLRLEARSLRRR